MRHFNLGLFFLLAIVFLSCKKEKDVTASGYIYQGCTKEPLKNQKVYFYDYRNTRFGGKIYYQDIATVTTDEKGFFVLNGKTKGDEWGVGFSDNDMFYKSTIVANVSNLGYYIKKSNFLKIVLDVDSTYTSSDIMQFNIYDAANNYLKKNGPFVNGQIIVSTSPYWQSEIHYLNDSEIKKVLPSISYKINNSSWKGSFKSVFNDCDTASVIIKID